LFIENPKGAAVGRGQGSVSLHENSRFFRKICRSTNTIHCAAAKKRPDEAAKLYAKAVKLRDAKYPADHPETARLLADYLAVLEQARRLEDAAVVRSRLGKSKPAAGGRD
jgi:hypothetical protein